jgi:protein transport protein SEC13
MKEEEKSFSFQTFHSGAVNNTEFSYNGMKIATCGNDGKINIFSTEKIFSNQKNISPDVELIKNGHYQPIYDLSFSYPCYGTYLASCGNDKKIIIWKEKSINKYENTFEYKHNSPVKCCKFAPYQYGIVVICGTDNGSISIHELQKNTQKWNSYLLENVHLKGINAIDWAPATPPINLEDEDNDDDNDLNMEEEIKNIEPMKFISCGNDCKINIYKSEENIIDSFVKEKSIDLENIIPRDIAFLHFTGYTELTFACGLDNGKCLIYKNNDGNWKNTFTINVGDNILKICWSTCGTYLGISSKKKNENDNNPVRFFRQNMDETWLEVK